MIRTVFTEHDMGAETFDTAIEENARIPQNIHATRSESRGDENNYFTDKSKFLHCHSYSRPAMLL